MDLSHSWVEALHDVMANGQEVSPRGKLTRELLHRTMQVDMRKPVLMVPSRCLSYKFMAAEAYWILSGDNRVETIAPYNRRITEFSDDGKIFFGAYGPRIASQLGYVLDKLMENHDTRQAGLTIWRERPGVTKDVPCTVAVFFNVRNSLLNAHVFMRSSDVWLGIPYDVFNFSMLAHYVCALLHERGFITSPGQLFLTAASSHLYEDNWAAAQSCAMGDVFEQRETPQILFKDSNEVVAWLRDLRATCPGDVLRWWEL